MTVYVVTGFGLNCEEETSAAYRKAGEETCIVHAADLFSGKVSLRKASIVHLSGGFSFGDDLGSGRVFVNRMKLEKRASGSTLLGELRAFVRDGGFVYGVCNGFQILVKSGLLPDVSGDGEPEVTLTHNDSGHFEDRWVLCRAESSPSPALRGIGTIALPVRHGEGKLVVREEAVRKALVERKLVALTYVEEDGTTLATAYPANPNGSELSCAGLTDATGRVLGTMPHPEAFLEPWLAPSSVSTGARTSADRPTGLALFRNLVMAARSAGRIAKDGHS